ncbi:hypothetical protein J6590_019512, partial [Homalodisca vitripennis]
MVTGIISENWDGQISSILQNACCIKIGLLNHSLFCLLRTNIVKAGIDSARLLAANDICLR